MKIRNSRSSLSLTSVARSAAAILVALCIYETNSQTTDTTPDASTLDGIKAVVNQALGTGKQYEVEPELAALFGLADSNGKWSVRGFGKRKASDSSLSSFAVSIDSKNDLYFVFKPSDKSYSVHWRSDDQGRVLVTLLSDRQSGTRVVPNSTYAKKFRMN
jgi:hypothetical protein